MLKNIAHKHSQFISCKIVFLLALSVSITACGRPYSSEAIEGWIVDADSKAPISGVVVTANWETEKGTVGGDVPTGQLWVSESVTDKNGRFFIKAMSEKRADGRLDQRDPQLLIFKKGYAYRKLINSRGFNSGSVRHSEWNGKTIEIHKFDGDLKSYGEHVYSLSSRVNNVLDVTRRSNECHWKNIPRMLVELQYVKTELKKNDIKLEGWRLGQQIMAIDNIPDNKCGRVSDFFKEYLIK